MKKTPLRVIKGGFAPADKFTAEELRSRKYKLGDLVFAKITRPRNPKFNRLVHGFGLLLTENIEAFEALDAHQVLKRIQLEADIACDEIAVIFPGIGPCMYRIPQSMSFESMDQDTFSKVFKRFCDYVAKKYWPTLTAEQVAEMAEMMPEE